jgi:PAS domain-containing protein
MIVKILSMLLASAPIPAAVQTQSHPQAQTVANVSQQSNGRTTGSTELSSPHTFSQLTAIAPQPSRNEKPARDDRTNTVTGTGDKKNQKRAANRRSAQLSRKRKKAFIEELKEENDDLRRKEQILMSIPDLVVVFDSSGKLWFVSQSVGRFLDFTVKELEGSSFWNRLCDDSVRLLKAAFMDSLAARSVDSDTAPLGTGFWELRLVDRDGSTKIVTLNGVVHFAGDRPECVCSIRPHEGTKVPQKNESSASAGGVASSTGSLYKSLIRVKPQQSVVSNVSSDSVTSSHRRLNRGPDAVRISDSGNSSGSSDGGGSDVETSVNA